MKLFRKTLILLVALMLVSSIWIVIRFDTPYPKALGPQFDAKIKYTYRNAIEENHPYVVLLGDSTVDLGVKVGKLSESLGRDTYKIGIPGSASAVWYLVLKNNILQSTYKPPYLILFFRDTLLTRPGDRVTGRYFTLVDELADHNEPLVTELSYVQQMNPIEKILDQYLPLYGNRLRVRDSLERQVRDIAPSYLLDCGTACGENAMSLVFSTPNLQQEVANQNLNDVERSLYGPDSVSFAQQVDRSYLPEMIRLCNQNGIRLIVVRTKTLVYPNEQSEPEALHRYIDDLSAYLKSNHVTFLDFSHDARIGDDLFFDSVHLTETGQAVFTNLLGDALQPIVK